MANRDLLTRAGVAAALSATNHDQNINSVGRTVEEQTGTTYTVAYTDQNKVIELNNATMTCTVTAAATIAAAIDTDGWIVTLVNTNAAAATIARSGSDTFSGATSITLQQYGNVTLALNSGGDGYDVIAGNYTGIVLINPSINDENGNELLEFVTTASAVNNLEITNKATGAAPVLGVSGEDYVGITYHTNDDKNLFKMRSAASSGTIANWIESFCDVSGNPAYLKCGETNSDLELTRNGTGDITVDGIPIYGKVTLDTPELLDATTTTGAWRDSTADFTEGSTTLAAAGAVKAIIKIDCTATKATSTSVAIQASIRKAGTSVTADQGVCGRAVNTTNSSATVQAWFTGYSEVNLDAGSDFEYYITNSLSATVTTKVYLVGYYV